MNIHEHQAKQILKKHGAVVPEGVFALTVDELVQKAKSLKTKKYVLKAQIHAGGRGKAGGVKILNTIEELKLLYEDYWKRVNQINTSIKLPLTIAINISDNKKILDFEKAIEKFDLVSSMNVFKLDNINIYYKVIFNGTPQAFILGMKKLGYNLDIKNKIWVLK